MRSSPSRLVEDAAEQAGRHRTGVVVGALVDGRRIFHGAGRKVVPDQHALFEIGSITKVFTATVLADEVVRGNLSLDQPVRELLPAGTAVPSRGAEITLGHLATHTSGLPRVPLGTVRPWVDFVMGRNPYAAVTPEVLLERLTRTTLKRRPGTGGVRYSNFGYGLLGLALQHATGAVDYDEMVTERVCRPLGLAHTGVRLPAGRLLAGHKGRDKQVERWQLTGMAGAGALLSSADDLLTFLAAQRNPGSTPLAEAIVLTQRQRIRGRNGMGLGWMRSTEPRLLLWHNGGTGGYRSYAGLIQERRTAVVVLTNHVRGVDITALRLLRALDPT